MIGKLKLNKQDKDVEETDLRDKVVINVPLAPQAQKALARHQYNRWRAGTKESKIYVAVLFALCSGKCPSCGQQMFLSYNRAWNDRNMSATLDHVTPISVALKHTKYGLQILCRKCNHDKDNKLPIHRPYERPKTDTSDSEFTE